MGGFAHLFRKIVKKAEGHIDGGYAPDFAVAPDRHGAVGARLRAGGILIRFRPGTLAFRGAHAVFVPRLLPVFFRFRLVPYGVDLQIAGVVAGKKGTKAVAIRRTVARQRPNPAAKDVEVVVLIHQIRQQGVNLVALQTANHFSDRALLRFDAVHLFRNCIALRIYRVADQLAFRRDKLWCHELANHQKRHAE